jgi:asparagine N-glycosylation enzyme membrane subunit Stt3
MTSDRTQLMLEQLHRYQDRVIYYLAAGFMIGFMMGFLCAWALERGSP